MKHLILNFIIFIILNISFFSLLTAQGSYENRTTIDKIIATVDGEPILFSDLKGVVSNVTRGKVKINPDGTFDGQSLKKKQVQQALDSLINNKIIEITIEERNLEASHQDVIQHARRELARKNVPQEQINEYLSDEKYLESFKKQLEIIRFQQSVLLPGIQISDDELKQEWLTRQGGENAHAKVRLRHFTLDIPEDESQKEEFDKKVQRIKNELLSGASFVATGLLHASNPNWKESKGLIPSISLSDLNPAFAKELAGTKKGESVGPIRLDGKVHFFLNKGFLESQLQDRFEEKRQQIYQQLAQQKMQERQNSWLEEKRSQTKIETFYY